VTASPVILVGSQRCGTTALAYAMNLAFDDAGGHFTVNGKLPYLLHRWLTGDDIRHRHLRTDEILHALDRRPPDGAGVGAWRARVEVGLRAAARAVAEGAATDDPVVLARSILTGAAQDLPFWGDKYNEYLLHLPYLNALLPDARYVVLVRHPEEVAWSVLQWTGDRSWRPVTRQAALEKWTTWNEAWLDFAPRVPATRRLVVEYHSLCRGEETDRLGDFVGLDLAPYLTGMRPRNPPCTADDLSPVTASVWQRLLAAAGQPASPPATTEQR
jgi:hypothetical protein